MSTTVENKKLLAKVLLNYLEAPGGYALNLKQPSLVFNNIDTVIAWAQGKITGDQIPQRDVLQQAATLFVQRACFRLENTHYDVLVLEQNFSLNVLKTRYRALISLTHPDKNLSGMPVNAAVRINQAYEILGDGVLRSQYDATLAVELPIPSRKPTQPIISRQSEKFVFADRLRTYILDSQKLVSVVIPLLFVLSVLAFVGLGQSPTDLHLVEKNSLSHVPSANTPITERSELNTTALTRSNSISKPEAIPSLATNTFRSATNTEKSLGVNLTLRQNPVKTNLESQSVFATDAKQIGSSTIKNLKTSSPSNTSNIAITRSIPTMPLVAVDAPQSQQVVKDSNTSQTVTTSNRLPSHSNEARALASQLIAALDQTKKVEAWQAKLVRDGVSGNLFGILLPRLSQSTVSRVDQLVLNEKLDNNNLILNGSVTLWLGTNSDQLIPTKYALNIEFTNTENRSIIRSFDIKEAR